MLLNRIDEFIAGYLFHAFMCKAAIGISSMPIASTIKIQ